ncbi:hypothetical protein BD410DRAFT_806407 [Rickenella mellea]|uniref:Uncharacterized protein n=1 Tax=Rickenella mellea TaxID=50990 RepID=A0A4Y7PUY9_9AGAM|nr:hypothetical protein BD410DRAFT_806407 [Rickenella mellea]
MFKGNRTGNRLHFESAKSATTGNLNINVTSQIDKDKVHVRDGVQRRVKEIPSTLTARYCYRTKEIRIRIARGRLFLARDEDEGERIGTYHVHQGLWVMRVSTANSSCSNTSPSEPPKRNEPQTSPPRVERAAPSLVSLITQPHASTHRSPTRYLGVHAPVERGERQWRGRVGDRVGGVGVVAACVVGRAGRRRCQDSKTHFACIGERIVGAVQRDTALKEKGILHERGQNPEQEKYHDESNPFEGAKEDKSESQEKDRVKAGGQCCEAKTGSRASGANAGGGPRSQARQTGTTANPTTDEGAATQAAHDLDDEQTRPGESEGREFADGAGIDGFERYMTQSVLSPHEARFWLKVEIPVDGADTDIDPVAAVASSEVDLNVVRWKSESEPLYAQASAHATTCVRICGAGDRSRIRVRIWAELGQNEGVRARRQREQWWTAVIIPPLGLDMNCADPTSDQADGTETMFGVLQMHWLTRQYWLNYDPKDVRLDASEGGLGFALPIAIDKLWEVLRVEDHPRRIRIRVLIITNIQHPLHNPRPNPRPKRLPRLINWIERVVHRARGVVPRIGGTNTKRVHRHMRSSGALRGLGSDNVETYGYRRLERELGRATHRREWGVGTVDSKSPSEPTITWSKRYKRAYLDHNLPTRGIDGGITRMGAAAVAGAVDVIVVVAIATSGSSTVNATSRSRETETENGKGKRKEGEARTRTKRVTNCELKIGVSVRNDEEEEEEDDALETRRENGEGRMGKEKGAYG